MAVVNGAGRRSGRAKRISLSWQQLWQGGERWPEREAADVVHRSSARRAWTSRSALPRGRG